MTSGVPVQALAVRLVEEEMSARRYAEPSRVTVRMALRDFLAWARKRGAGNPLRFGKKDLCAFHAWLCRQRSKRNGEPLAASTINNRFGAVRTLYSCLYRAGHISENPTHGLDLRVPENPGWKRRPLTREEVTRFLESIDTSTSLGLKDRALFELIYSSGLRVSEAAGLKVADVDFERRQMIVRGKYDRDRAVPIGEVAGDILRVYLGRRTNEPDAWVFPGEGGGGSHQCSRTISRRFRTLLKRFGMSRKEISTHSLRHSTATHLLENGASVRHVQELMGHSNIESTVRYTHVMIDGLAKVFRKYHPREHELFEAMDDEYERRLQVIMRYIPQRTERALRRLARERE